MTLMLAVTHLFIALLLIRAFNLDRNTAFMTLLFGVFIDLDHIFGMIDFVTREGLGNALNLNAALTSDVQWKSLLHSPEGILFVGPVALITRMLVPLLAWGLHILLDYVQIYYLGICSPLEILLMALLFIALLAYEKKDHDAVADDPSLRGLLKWEVQRISEYVTALPVIRQIKRSRGLRGTSS
jgi:hypothetical protein